MGKGNGVVVPTLRLRSQPSHRHIVGSPGCDPVAQLADDLRESGVGPHGPEAWLIFLACIARYAGISCSVAVIGPSGCGKTTLLERLVSMMPTADVRILTDLTYASLKAGLGWGTVPDERGQAVVDLRRRLVVLDENMDMRANDRRVMACLRQAMSATRTTFTKMGKHGPETTTLLGPTTVCDCRLNTASVEYETANRMLPISLRADPHAVDAILVLTAVRPTVAGRRAASRANEIARGWRRFLSSLDQELPVVIDYADQLQLATGRKGAGHITHGARILTAVHAVVSAVAWLRQGTRTRHRDPVGEGPVIYATRDDYRTARQILCEASVLDERPQIPGPAFEVLKRWQAYAETAGNPPVTAPTLYRQIGVVLDRGNQSRHLHALIDAEVAMELSGRNRNRQKQYQLTPPGLRAATISLMHTLPSADEIAIEGEEESSACSET